jgi:uncharacterized protein (TIGR03435 family)
MPGLALVQSKGGAKLASAEKPGGSGFGKNVMRGSGVPISALVDMLVRTLGRPVIDQTGLTGIYDFRIDFSPVEPDANGADTLPSIFDALQQRLGLRLDAAKAPVEVIVIDRAEKPSMF